MDPLSITASTVTLIQASGIIAASLNRLVLSLRTVDTRIMGLCNEVSALKGSLAAIKKTLNGCKPGVTLVEHGLWQQIELCLANCQTTLNELGILVDNIQGSSRTKGFGWRARAVVDLSNYSDDIATFQDRLHKSHCVLNTVLDGMLLSVSLKNNDSQRLVLQRLDELKTFIDEAHRTALSPVVGSLHAEGSSAHLTRNVRRLAEEAKHFHTTVSSSAGTTTCGSNDLASKSNRNAAMSVFGDFSSLRRERVQRFLQGNSFRKPEPGVQQPYSTRKASGASSSYTCASRPIDATERADGNANRSFDVQKSLDRDAEDMTLERTYIEGLRDLAMAHIKALEYNKAIEYLKEALKQGASGHEGRQMKMQLALCHFVQGKWQLAEPHIQALTATQTEDDLFVCNLLHALALAYISSNYVDKGLMIAKQALIRKMRLWKINAIESKEYWISLQRFTTALSITGDDLRAEVFFRQLPSNFEDDAPKSEVDFVRRHMITQLNSSIDVPFDHTSTTPLSCSAEDELSPSTSTHSPLRRRFSRLFGLSCQQFGTLKTL